MAYNFVRTSSQHITGNISNVDVPLTMAMWFNRTNISNNASLLALDTIGVTNYHQVLQNAGNAQIIAQTNNGTQVAQQSTSGANVVAGTWQHGVGRFTAITNRRVFLDGVIGASSGTSRVVTNNRLNIGARESSGVGSYMLGELAEVAVWQASLTEDEITSLSKGFRPTRIRPQSLVYYVPLVRNLTEVRSALALTANNGPTVADHPRVY